MTTRPPRWVHTSEVATAAGLTSDTSIRLRIKKSGTWRGHELVIRSLPGPGRNGSCSLIRVDSLPVDVQEALAPLSKPAAIASGASSPAGGTTTGPPDGALQSTPARSRRRSGKRGKPHKWPPPRIRSELGLPPDALLEIDRQLRVKGRSLLNTGIGMRRATDYLSIDAYDLCREAGCTLPEAQLRKLCRIKRAFVTHLRPGRFVPALRRDAKAWADRHPGPSRDWTALSSPLALLIGDVTPLDIRFVLSDGSEQKLRLIAWLDAKTNRLAVHVFAPERGTGVRMEHVAASFAWLAMTWGLPEALYIDRGGEYGWAGMIDHAVRIVRSLPYNARSKKIEPIFAALLRFIAEIAGFIGSDRMRKKTQSVGRPAEPFPGTIEELVAAVQDAVAHYNTTPQAGLGDRSPDQAWQAEIDAGWRTRKADEAMLIEALCRRVERKVSRGTVRIDGAVYTAEELWRRADLEGETVIVAVSLFGFEPAVFDRTGAFVCHLYEEISYHPLDPEGARESARRKRIRNQGGRALLAEHPPADLQDYRRRVLALSLPPDDSPAGEPFELPGEAGRAAASRRNLIVGRRKDRAALPAPAANGEDEPDYFERLRAAEDRRRLEASGGLDALPNPEGASEEDWYDLVCKLKGSAA